MMVAVIVLGAIIFLMLPLWVEGFKIVFSEMKKKENK